MGSSGFEPPTSRLSGARSNQLSYEPVVFALRSSAACFRLPPWSFSPIPTPGGDDGIRTHDPLLAGQVLSHLSYTPLRGSLKNEQQRYRTPKISVYHLELSLRSSLNSVPVPWVLLYPELFSRSALPRSRFCEARRFAVLHRKEVIQPHLPIRLPCYDLTPIIEPTFDCCLLAVSSQASGVPNFHGLTGGVYKARERIHRSMLTCDY